MSKRLGDQDTSNLTSLETKINHDVCCDIFHTISSCSSSSSSSFSFDVTSSTVISSEPNNNDIVATKQETISQLIQEENLSEFDYSSDSTTFSNSLPSISNVHTQTSKIQNGDWFLGNCCDISWTQDRLTLHAILATMVVCLLALSMSSNSGGSPKPGWDMTHNDPLLRQIIICTCMLLGWRILTHFFLIPFSLRHVCCLNYTLPTPCNRIWCIELLFWRRTGYKDNHNRMLTHCSVYLIVSLWFCLSLEMMTITTHGYLLHAMQWDTGLAFFMLVWFLSAVGWGVVLIIHPALRSFHSDIYHDIKDLCRRCLRLPITRSYEVVRNSCTEL